VVIAVPKHKDVSKRSSRLTVLLPVLMLVAGTFAIGQDANEDPTLSAGSFTIKRFDRQAFSEPAAVLTA